MKEHDSDYFNDLVNASKKIRWHRNTIDPMWISGDSNTSEMIQSLLKRNPTESKSVEVKKEVKKSEPVRFLDNPMEVL